MNNNEDLLKAYMELGKKAQDMYINTGLIVDKDLSEDILKIESSLVHKKAPSREAMICPSCSSTYDEESIYCAYCGFHIEGFYKNHTYCLVCGNLVNVDDNYCQACGKILKVDETNELR